jgi:hypothetical protein
MFDKNNTANTSEPGIHNAFRNTCFIFLGFKRFSKIIINHIPKANLFVKTVLYRGLNKFLKGAIAIFFSVRDLISLLPNKNFHNYGWRYGILIQIKLGARQTISTSVVQFSYLPP